MKVFITAHVWIKNCLKQCSEGLIASSACLHGEIASHIVRGNMDEARKSAREYQEIFGEEQFLSGNHGKRHSRAENCQSRV
ncbi:MAG: PHP domain-containing protein [Candidatus Moduliflexus flocculans]|nr:PHP domain-containing protein [Candidatus Moduliflexus flocculans]